MMIGHHWGNGGHFVLGLIVLAVLVALIAAAIVLLLRAFGPRSASPAQHHQPPAGVAPPQPTAREILDRRLAGGEITPAQYDEIRAKLGAGSG